MQYPIIISPDMLQALVIAALSRDHADGWTKQFGTRWAANPVDLTDHEIDRVVREAEARFSLKIRWIRRPMDPEVAGEAMRPNWLSRRVGAINKVILNDGMPVELDTVLHEIAHLLPDAEDHNLAFVMNYARLLEHFLGVDRETFWEAYRDAVRVARQEVINYITHSFDGLFDYDTSLEPSGFAMEAT